MDTRAHGAVAAGVVDNDGAVPQRSGISKLLVCVQPSVFAGAEAAALVEPSRDKGDEGNVGMVAVVVVVDDEVGASGDGSRGPKLSLNGLMAATTAARALDSVRFNKSAHNG
jgi:hypothetical protein